MRPVLDELVVVSLGLAPIVVEEPVDDEVEPELWAVLPAVSADGVVVAPPLVDAPAPVLGVAAGEVVVLPAAPAPGVLPVVPDDVWAQARPNVPANAAAMTVMLNFL